MIHLPFADDRRKVAAFDPIVPVPDELVDRAKSIVKKLTLKTFEPYSIENPRISVARCLFFRNSSTLHKSSGACFEEASGRRSLRQIDAENGGDAQESR